MNQLPLESLRVDQEWRVLSGGQAVPARVAKGVGASGQERRPAAPHVVCDASLKTLLRPS